MQQVTLELAPPTHFAGLRKVGSRRSRPALNLSMNTNNIRNILLSSPRPSPGTKTKVWADTKILPATVMGKVEETFPFAVVALMPVLQQKTGYLSKKYDIDIQYYSYS